MDAEIRKTKQKTSDCGDRFICYVVLWISGKLWEISSKVCLCLASVLLFCSGVHDSSIEYSLEALLPCSIFIVVINYY